MSHHAFRSVLAASLLALAAQFLLPVSNAWASAVWNCSFNAKVLEVHPHDDEDWARASFRIVGVVEDPINERACHSDRFMGQFFEEHLKLQSSDVEQHLEKGNFVRLFYTHTSSHPTPEGRIDTRESWRLSGEADLDQETIDAFLEEPKERSEVVESLRSILDEDEPHFVADPIEEQVEMECGKAAHQEEYQWCAYIGRGDDWGRIRLSFDPDIRQDLSLEGLQEHFGLISYTFRKAFSPEFDGWNFPGLSIEGHTHRRDELGKKIIFTNYEDGVIHAEVIHEFGSISGFTSQGKTCLSHQDELPDECRIELEGPLQLKVPLVLTIEPDAEGSDD